MHVVTRLVTRFQSQDSFSPAQLSAPPPTPLPPLVLPCTENSSEVPRRPCAFSWTDSTIYFQKLTFSSGGIAHLSLAELSWVHRNHICDKTLCTQSYGTLFEKLALSILYFVEQDVRYLQQYLKKLFAIFNMLLNESFRTFCFLVVDCDLSEDWSFHSITFCP